MLTGNLSQLTGGETQVELTAATVQQLFRELGKLYPDLEPQLRDGIAVAIDGQIYQDAWLEPIPPDSEVHLLPQIAGG